MLSNSRVTLLKQAGMCLRYLMTTAWLFGNVFIRIFYTVTKIPKKPFSGRETTKKEPHRETRHQLSGDLTRYHSLRKSNTSEEPCQVYMFLVDVLHSTMLRTE